MFQLSNLSRWLLPLLRKMFPLGKLYRLLKHYELRTFQPHIENISYVIPML
jgi:hypothetical protein